MGSQKISGRYRLVLLNQNNQAITISCDLLKGTILPSLAKKNGTDLTILDLYMLTNIESEKDLLDELKKLGYPVTEDCIPKFAYQHNGITKYLELIYQSDKLCTFANMCLEYKKRYSDYGNRNHISSKRIRRMISSEICQEKEWKKFYQELIEDIHNPEFYDYLHQYPILGERALGYIDDYLNNEAKKTRSMKEAFDSAEYYLIDTFTAYKPIRGMIICKQNYLRKYYLTQEVAAINLPKKDHTCSFDNPFLLLSDIQLAHLESHEAFNKMTRKEQEDVILASLGLTRQLRTTKNVEMECERGDIPWYQRTISSLSEAQILYLESHPNFEVLSDIEKVQLANSLLVESGYQKRL